MKRAGRQMRARSSKTVALSEDRRQVVAAANARDGNRCQAIGLIPGHRCYGPLVGHELRKRSQMTGAAYVLNNVLTVCCEANDWVEREPALAHELGLVVRTGETSRDAWTRMRVARRRQ